MTRGRQRCFYDNRRIDPRSASELRVRSPDSRRGLVRDIPSTPSPSDIRMPHGAGVGAHYLSSEREEDRLCPVGTIWSCSHHQRTQIRCHFSLSRCRTLSRRTRIEIVSPSLLLSSVPIDMSNRQSPSRHRIPLGNYQIQNSSSADLIEKSQL